MIIKIKKIWSDKLVRGTFILSAGTILGSVFSFLVHPVLSRYLPVAEYGDFQAFLSFITILGVVGAVVRMVVTKEVAALAAIGALASVSYLRRQAIRHLSLIGAGLFLLVALLAPVLGAGLQISRPWLLVIVAAYLLYIFPLTVNRAVLAGRQFFSSLAALNISEPVFKFFLVLVLVAGLAGGISGAAWSLALASVPAWFLSFYLLKRADRSVSGDAATSQDVATAETSGLAAAWSWSKFQSYGLLVLWFTALSQFFYNFDMLFVKAHFSPDEAGLYGALLTVGRIIFFVGGSVPLVMFPVIAGLKNDPSPRRFFVLLKSLGLMAVLAGPAFLIIALWPELMIRLVVGVKYLAIAPYLPLFAVAILLLTMMTVLSQYFLALAKRRGLLVLSLGAGAEIIFLTFFRADFWQIIWSLVGVFALINLALLILLAREYRLNRSGAATAVTLEPELISANQEPL